ncbi:MAG: hypothetical protein ACHP6I_01940 [Rickettsiales bacterium]
MIRFIIVNLVISLFASEAFAQLQFTGRGVFTPQNGAQQRGLVPANSPQGQLIINSGERTPIKESFDACTGKSEKDPCTFAIVKVPPFKGTCQKYTPKATANIPTPKTTLVCIPSPKETPQYVPVRPAQAPVPVTQ